jgi:hypothetical protein
MCEKARRSLDTYKEIQREGLHGRLMRRALVLTVDQNGLTLADSAL